MTPSVVLASSSKTRQKILLSAGVKFDVVSPRLDEEEIKQSMIAERAGAAEIAEVLAEQKARSISRQRPDDLVIGADQILEMQGQIFSKPPNYKIAQENLVRLRGRDHRLFSCVCIVHGGDRIWHALDSATLTMREFSDEFLHQYLDLIGEKALSGPGSYRIEDEGSQLFSAITGDFFTILGLPLLPLLEFLRVRGVLRA